MVDINVNEASNYISYLFELEVNSANVIILLDCSLILYHNEDLNAAYLNMFKLQAPLPIMAQKKFSTNSF